MASGDGDRNGTLATREMGPGAVETQAPVGRPDPETRAKAKRRQFTAEYKLRIVEAASTCGPGELGALLRREGLYSSHLTDWRREAAAGALSNLGPKKRGRRGSDAAAKRIAELEHELQVTREKLKRAELVIDVQGKVSRLLGVSPGGSESGAEN